MFILTNINHSNLKKMEEKKTLVKDIFTFERTI